MLDFLFKVFREKASAPAIIWNDQIFDYSWLLAESESLLSRLRTENIPIGSVVIINSDYSPRAVALLLALLQHKAIIIPLVRPSQAKKEQFLQISGGEYEFVFSETDEPELRPLENPVPQSELYQTLFQRKHPGLVLFSSGSTGESKATVHDFAKLLTKFRVRRHDLSTVAILQFDHIGGIDTLFYTLSNGSCLTVPREKTPHEICRLVEKFKIEVLPASPTFLNLLILSKVYEQFDLSSLKYITYGAEVMPESTLKKCSELFPGVTILQKYGTTEVGTLRSKSQSSDSLWVKIGGEGYQTRVVDGILQIKSSSAMLGYLNAESPFTEDGWFITGDVVEQNGEYLKILGRKSELINVAGKKVFPTEIENILLAYPGVIDAAVYAEKNPLIGHIVCARIWASEISHPQQFVKDLKKYCAEHLDNYKVPVKIQLSKEPLHTERFKKTRRRFSESE